MKTIIRILVATSCLFMAGQAVALDAKAAEALAQKNGCLACHTIKQKVIGPALQDIAAKYRGEQGAEAKLIGRVKNGTSGVWGPVPMRPNSPQVKDEDIKLIVQWILTL
ncbi:c-type cytochrome [Methylobacillus arboreus]|uniref:c-type cytochrome n=1 Tax=Methylobacillus arboreus TaxID=755170 RepID=UPI001E312BD4|nr:c-type cytochrome [Methylobacillus arboreus]MCB5191114.1 c-type cytochrome [Methylobacillus arboreus]